MNSVFSFLDKVIMHDIYILWLSYDMHDLAWPTCYRPEGTARAGLAGARDSVVGVTIWVGL